MAPEVGAISNTNHSLKKVIVHPFFLHPLEDTQRNEDRRN